ncbi:probable G-protein coupled receptor 139 [Stegostoma tigrinum]|uniref:probable G-protein coupled receptor 139 n=1 Tax=Stegostoma tigrinum TaxID=3053191 RepID=UPI00287097E8|nr:probable G-protein coupled receptor 139 [Stegostoma tigrinum]
MHGRIIGLAFAISYPILGAIGVPANVTAIVILSRGKCGLSKCITRYLVAMAVSDLLVTIIGVILNRINGLFFPYSFLYITPLCTLRSFLLFVARDSSVWITIAFTFDRYVTICCQKLKRKYCTEKCATTVILTVCVLFCLKNIPWCFAFRPSYIVNGISWYCNLIPEYYTSQIWIAFDLTDTLLGSFVAFVVILLLNALTGKYILVASRVRWKLRANCSGETNHDPEWENRRNSIILLFSISGSFILLWMPYLIVFVYMQIANHNSSSGSNSPLYIAQEVAFLLQLLSCCTNTCIYAVTQRKFREELKNGIRYARKFTEKLFTS